MGALRGGCEDQAVIGREEIWNKNRGSVIREEKQLSRCHDNLTRWQLSRFGLRRFLADILRPAVKP